MQCEQCNVDINGVEEAHSMLVVLQKVDQSGYSFFQCESGSLVHGHTFQHWHCSRDEMLIGVQDCINNHHDEQFLQSVPVSQVRLHMHVLNAGLICKVCQEPLKEQAYRFCLTVATPSNYVPDESHDSSKEWCCSLDHARQSALSILDSLKEK